MTLIEEHELLFHLAYEWEANYVISSPIMTEFSKDNPYREAVEVTYNAFIKEVE